MPADRLRLTVEGDRSWPTVKPVWATPLSRPGKNLALLDGKGDEIVLISDPDRDLPADSWAAVQVELYRRNLTAVIKRVLTVKIEFRSAYWSVETDRGKREFVTQNLRENAQWITDDHLLLLDVNGNRFELPNIPGLDKESHALLMSVV